MVRMIRTDFKKIFSNSQIYICMLGLSTIYILSCMEHINAQKFDGDIINIFGGLVSNTTLLFSFLMCIVGGSFLYCAEEKHGYMKFGIQRTGVEVYTISKLITSVIGGFVTSLVGMILSIGAVLPFCYAVYEYDQRSALLAFSTSELVSFIWEVILISLGCGLLAAGGFLVTTFYANYCIGMTAPILVYYALLVLYKWFKIPRKLMHSYVFFIGMPEDVPVMLHLVYAVGYLICILIGFYVIAKRRIQRRLEHA